MAFKLAIAQFVLVPLAFSLADGDKESKFSFQLQAKRLNQDEWKQRFPADDGVPTNDKLKDVMLDITTGWRDQVLVLDEEGQPAAFCQEALQALFEVPGVFDLYVSNYLKEVRAKVKN